jgi:hypothetical protein
MLIATLLASLVLSACGGPGGSPQPDVRGTQDPPAQTTPGTPQNDRYP